METLEVEFNNITKMKIFEIEVLNLETNELDYIIFNIEIDGNNLVAAHVGLTTEQEQSNKIAFTSIELDDCFSLDENLQNLHDECINNIMNGNLYKLI